MSQLNDYLQSTTNINPNIVSSLNTDNGDEVTELKQLVAALQATGESLLQQRDSAIAEKDAMKAQYEEQLAESAKIILALQERVKTLIAAQKTAE